MQNSTNKFDYDANKQNEYKFSDKQHLPINTTAKLILGRWTLDYKKAAWT